MLKNDKSPLNINKWYILGTAANFLTNFIIFK